MPLPDNPPVIALARGVWDGKALTGVKDLLVTGKGTGESSRLAFGTDGLLYMTSGGDDATTQDPTTHAGKVLRLKDDGTAAPGNPFAGKGGNSAEVWTVGHRNGMALAVRPGTNELWEDENGPNGGDEINVLVAGGNYGWPLVSLGRTTRPWQSGLYRGGMIDPVVYWTPAIDLGPRLLHGREAAKGRQRFRAPAHGEIPGHRHRADPVQRQDGRAAPRAVARRPAATHPRRAKAPTSCSTSDRRGHRRHHPHRTQSGAGSARLRARRGLIHQRHDLVRIHAHHGYVISLSIS
jgi:hypothetical protein